MQQCIFVAGRRNLKRCHTYVRLSASQRDGSLPCSDHFLVKKVKNHQLVFFSSVPHNAFVILIAFVQATQLFMCDFC